MRNFGIGIILILLLALFVHVETTTATSGQTYEVGVNILHVREAARWGRRYHRPAATRRQTDSLPGKARVGTNVLCWGPRRGLPNIT